MPLVSVVIPSYNHARFVGQAVASVLEQTHADLELIVIDDGSRDESPQILQAIRDPRMRLELQANAGAHAAINRGLERARGELLTVLNSDDRYLPERLARAVAAFAADPRLGTWGSWVEVIDAHGQRLGVKEGYKTLLPVQPEYPELTFMVEDDLELALLQSNFWSTTSNFVFRREVLERAGGMRPLRFAHDWDFAFRARRVAPAWLEPEPLLQYRVHGANTIRENRVGMIFEILWVLAQHLPSYLDHPALDLSGGDGTVRRIEQLRRSLHLHGCDRTFLHMLLLARAAAARGAPLAEDLLRADHPVRHWLIGEIAAELEERERTTPAAAPAQGRLSSWKRRLRRLGWTPRQSP